MSLFGRDRAPRRGTPFGWLIVGLGNPGKEYHHSRHNVGADCIELIARRVGAQLRAGRDKALVAETTLAGQRCVLAFPTTYMNLSGEAVGALVRRYGIDEPTKIVVVHDELDLAPGTMRVKVGGGLAGHNGLRSITQHLKTQDYVRVRIGVGKPNSKEQGANHVLSRIPAAEREVLDVMIERAADAVEAVVELGPDAAMARFNGA
ncbi:MAG: peptidyl-tRNA hydrolase [Actinomycetota bacterium]